MKNILIVQYLTALLLVICLRVQGQDAHQPLVCSGKIPSEFTTASTAKYNKAIRASSAKKTNKRTDKTVKKFALESNFAIDDLLQSGRVLFNDEVSAYLDDVVQQLLKAKPLSRRQPLHVYTLRSYAVNAFATDRGDIFVTLGLLAQLENEAQLACILAHEIAHIEEKHAINFYLEAEKVDREKSRSVLKRSSTDDKLLAKCVFSKNQETQADQLGLERLLLSQYRTATLPVIFEVLKYSYLPFDDRVFDRDLLQSENYQIPDDYWLETVKAIEGIAMREEDRHSSHPDLQSRLEAMQKILADKPDSPDKSDYLVSADRFAKMRTLARFELPMLYLHTDRLAEAIYTSSLLLQEKPEDLWLQKCIAKALYIHAKFSRDDDYRFEGDFEKVEGQSQQIHHLLEKMPAKEAVVLALQYAWNFHKAHPEDAEIKTITEDLFVELVKAFDHLDQFSNEVPKPEPTPIQPTDTAAFKPVVSKYDRIRNQAKGKPAFGDNDYWKYAFAGDLTSEAFKKYWAAAEKRRDEWSKKERYFESAKGTKAMKRQRKKGRSLGIPKIAIVNPYYLKLDERKGQAVQFIATEEGQENFHQLIREVSAMSDLKTTLLDVRNLKETQSDMFNDIRFLNEWFAEQSRHYDLTLTPGYDQERINAIAKKYGTDYFLWTGVISLREKKKYAWAGVAASLMVFFPVTPLAAYMAVKPKYEMLHYALLYDVRTGRHEVLKFETFKRRDSDAVIKAHLYDTFTQIKRSR